MTVPNPAPQAAESFEKTGDKRAFHEHLEKLGGTLHEWSPDEVARVAASPIWLIQLPLERGLWVLLEDLAAMHKTTPTSYAKMLLVYATFQEYGAGVMNALNAWRYARAR